MHRYEVEVTVGSARELKNVNWRHGELKPYVVLWVNDDGPKCSTRVDLDHGENPDWDDEKLLVPLPPSAGNRLIEDAVLCIDVVHADAAKEEDVKPLVGSARLPLRDVGVGDKISRTLRLKRPSGRPQGRLDVRVTVRRDNPSPYPYPSPYAQGYPAAAPGAGGYGYGYGGGAPPQPAYGGYDAATTTNKSSGGKMGMGTGLAVGAAAGVLGGLALAGGASYLGDKADDDDDDY
ncbi:hypothetical protein PR202_ga21828 [Eleusine coracana subsp. coracana]|uniref:C2 domain-containing protein n=1 Tax=Eleusine coracana subsp. coracana TaxID=191504 RepID=A0AAV5D222_ELECO|nr:hypothetical protein QOZ80_8AG0641190 [Eleusine coracana subsp. coracana]GJN04290.1 hypothetical protein PR202_ga21828 [Eleusine coracana subsp. coracana]